MQPILSLAYMQIHLHPDGRLLIICQSSTVIIQTCTLVNKMADQQREPLFALAPASAPLCHQTDSMLLSCKAATNSVQGVTFCTCNLQNPGRATRPVMEESPALLWILVAVMEELLTLLWILVDLPNLLWILAELLVLLHG